MNNKIRKSSPGEGRSLSTVSLRTDNEGKIISASPELLSILGKLPNEIEGKPLDHLAQISDPSGYGALLQAGKGTVNSQVQLHFPGTEPSREWTFEVCFQDEGSINAPILLWQATEKEVENDPEAAGDQAGEWFRQSSQPTLICRVGDWQLLYVNKAAAELYKYPEEQLVKLNLADLFVGGRSAEALGNLKNSGAFQLDNVEALNKNRHGVAFTVFLSGNTITYNSVPALLVHIQSRVQPSLRDMPARDTDNRLTREQEQEKLKMLVSSLDDIVMEFDLDFRYQGVWCRDESLLIEMPSKLIGRTVQEVLKNEPEVLRNNLEDLQFVKDTGNLAIREYSLRLKNGLRWFKGKIAPVFGADGVMSGFSKRITDITERKKVELAIEENNRLLREAHRELKEIFDHATEIIYKLDHSGRLIFVSPEFARLFGYSDTEILGTPYLDLVQPEDRNASWSRFNDAGTGKMASRDNIIRLRRKDGTYAWLSCSTTRVNVEEDQDYYLLGFARDITSLKLANESLREAEERYRMFIYQSTEGIWRFETPEPPDISLSPEEMIAYFARYGYLAECNEAYARMYGFEKAEQMAGMPLSELLSAENSANVEFFLSFIRAGFKLKDAETAEYDRDGNLKYFLNNLVGIIEHGRLLRVWGTQRDITHQREAQTALRESEERFRQLADTAPVMIWVSDEHDRTTYVNQSWVNFTGIASDTFADDTWLQIVHPEDVPIAISDYRKNIYERKPIHMEYRLLSVTGEYKWVIDTGVPRFLDDGRFVGYVGTVMDIHDRRLAEEKLRYQAMVMQNVNDAVIATDLKGKILSWNKAAERIYGLTEEEVAGRNYDEVVSYRYLNISLEGVMSSIMENGSWAGELYFDHHEGRRVYLQVSVTLLRNERQEPIGRVGIQHDITESRMAAESMRISEVRHRSLFEALGEGIVLYDKEGRVIAANSSAQKIFGMPEGHLVGSASLCPAGRLTNEDGSTFDINSHPIRCTLKKGGSCKEVIIGVQQYGRLVWLSVNTEPIYYTENRDVPDGVVASFVDITGKKEAELELQENDRKLREYSGRIMGILESITDGFMALDRSLEVILWNPTVERVTGIPAGEAIGRKITNLFPAISNADFFPEYTGAILRKETVVREHYFASKGIWFETTAYPSGNGVFVYFRDISERKLQEEFLSLENRVLEINARQSSTLRNTVDYLLEGIEKIFSDAQCSVLTLDDDELTLRHLSAPSLPAAYIEAIDGEKIGPRCGSCGTAIFRKEEVIVGDIYVSPLWIDYLPLAKNYAFRACWSFPVKNAANRVLATVATYFKSPRIPTSSEKAFFHRLTNILRVVIENKKTEALVRQTNERYLLATMATNDAIWDWDVANDNLYWGEGFYSLFGYKAGNYAGKMCFWEKQIHPQDRERVVQGLLSFCDGRQAQLWEDEYRFLRSDGKYVLVHDRGFLIFNQHGKVSRMVGSMQDITEKREMEKRLLKQELDRQKLVAQAVVEAQEKERALIGKELHDNVNQILSTAKLYLELANGDDKEIGNLLSMSASNISDAINEIRSISRSLVPSSIDDLGLIDSINDLIENLKATRKLSVEFFHRGDVEGRLDEQQKLMLFRIIQEQVSNVLKHAEASHLLIELVLEENHGVSLSVHDDGVGFDYSKIKGKKGIGLSNMASRAELFNGKIDMVTAPGKGCSLHVHVPIQ